MNFPHINYITLLISLLFIICSLLFLFYRSIISLKKEEFKKAIYFTRKIQNEKKRAEQIKIQVEEIVFVKQSIDNDFFKIKTEILSIDFTIKEICKFI